MVDDDGEIGDTCSMEAVKDVLEAIDVDTETGLTAGEEVEDGEDDVEVETVSLQS